MERQPTLLNVHLLREYSNNALILAGIHIYFTGIRLEKFVIEIIKKYDLTLQQYNTLRILSRAYPDTLNIKQVNDQMLDANSNTTRIADKLENKQLIIRKTDISDRRLVKVELTQKGKNLTKEVTDKIEELYIERIQQYLSEDDSQKIIALLSPLKEF